MNQVWTNLLVSSFSGLVTALIVNYWNKQNIKKEITFSLTFNDLVPNVYMPIINEYRKYLDEANSQEEYIIDIKIIEKTIINNKLLINFAPKEVKNTILIIYSTCKMIKSGHDYDKSKKNLIDQLKTLETKLTEKFEEFIL